MKRAISNAFVVCAIFVLSLGLLASKAEAKGGNFQVEVVTDDGFGVTSPANTYAYEMKYFDENFYTTMFGSGIGGIDSPGSVWRSSSGDTGTWTLSGTVGMGDTTNRQATSLEVFKGELYVGFSNPDGLRIYKTSDGVTWVQAVGNTSPSLAGFGDTENQHVGYLRTFDNGVDGDLLWAIVYKIDDDTDSWKGIEIYCSANGSTWVQQALPVGYDPLEIKDVFVFGGYLNILAIEDIETGIMGIVSTNGVGYLTSIAWSRPLETATFLSDILPTNGIYVAIDKQNSRLILGNESGGLNDAKLWYTESNGDGGFNTTLIKSFTDSLSVFPVTLSPYGEFAVVFGGTGFDFEAKLYRIDGVTAEEVIDTGITFDVEALGALYSAERVTTGQFFNYFYVAGGGINGTIYRVDVYPSSSVPTAVQKTDGSGNVEITFTVGDIFDGDYWNALVEYNIGGGWKKATLSTVVGSYGATYPPIGINNNLNDYQVGGDNGGSFEPTGNYIPQSNYQKLGTDGKGEDNYIWTSQGANTIFVTWLSKTDEPTASLNEALFRITVADPSLENLSRQKISIDSTVDNVAPVLSAFNLADGQLVSTNPYIIKIKANDLLVKNLMFYVDGTLICDVTTPDSQGYYTCSWDTSKYHSDVRVVTYDMMGNSSETTANVTVNLNTLTRTGDPVLNIQMMALGVLCVVAGLKVRRYKFF
jgi:hypothetical protein